MDVAVWLAASMLQFLGVGLLVSITGTLEVALGTPSWGFWLSAAALLWLGTALGLMTFGAAGSGAGGGLGTGGRGTFAGGTPSYTSGSVAVSPP